MSKEAEKFIGLYEVGKNDWLTKHKDVIAKLMQSYAEKYHEEQMQYCNCTKPSISFDRIKWCTMCGKDLIPKQ